ncbi:MAG: hypothetical protein M4579_006399 [Chaenotheca gracillima]|nr:MAG: hypothetical protein M4579_006399 [Chaenotheca gracillima]
MAPDHQIEYFPTPLGKSEANPAHAEIESCAAQILTQALSFAITHLGVKVATSRTAPESHPNTSQDVTAPEWKAAKVVRAPPYARVQTKTKNYRGQHWIGRFSTHPDSAMENSTTFDEMKDGLIRSHATQEGDWAADVHVAHHVLSYPIPNDGVIDSFTKVEMGIYEMGHKTPPMVSNRLFTVLTVSADVNQQGSIVVSIPLEVDDFELVHGSLDKRTRKRYTQGRYVAVEYVSRDAGADYTVWSMATSSDAEGWIPKSLQRWKAKTIIAEDVPSFLEWRITQRRISLKAIP